MNLLPGWDSTDLTEAIAHHLHIAAVVVLALLVVAEALALIYDTRNHHLVRVAAGEAERQRVRQAQALQEQQSKIIGLETRIAQRTLTDSEIAEMAKSLEQYAPKNSRLLATGTSPERLPLA
jgi:hypothetical protein